MIKYRLETSTKHVFDSFICDKCKKEITDTMELQETHSIHFTGGYASVFGDMNTVACDLCQQCLLELIGAFCTYNADDEDPNIEYDDEDDALDAEDDCDLAPEETSDAVLWPAR